MPGIGPTGTPQPPQGPDPKRLDSVNKPLVGVPDQTEFKEKIGDSTPPEALNKMAGGLSQVTPAQVAEIQKDVKLGRTRDEIAINFVTRELGKVAGIPTDQQVVSQLKDMLLEDKNFSRIFNQLLHASDPDGNQSMR